MEVLWASAWPAQPGGRLLRGPIALAAAGVKAREGNARGLVCHARWAGAIFRDLGAERSVVLGLAVAALTAFAEGIAAEPPCHPAEQRAPPEVVFPAPLTLSRLQRPAAPR